MTAQLQAARERGRQNGLILLARLRHNITFQNLQRDANGAHNVGVRDARFGASPAALNLPAGDVTVAQREMTTTGARALSGNQASGLHPDRSARRRNNGPSASTLGSEMAPTTGGCTSYEVQ